MCVLVHRRGVGVLVPLEVADIQKIAATKINKEYTWNTSWKYSHIEGTVRWIERGRYILSIRAVLCILMYRFTRASRKSILNGEPTHLK